MAFIQKFFTSYSGTADGNTRTGELNRLWYDSHSNTIRIGDGTAGGKLVGGAGGSGSSLPSDAAGYLHNDGNGNLDWSTTILALGNLSVGGTDLQTIIGSQTNKDIELQPNGTGLVAVPGLKIPVGSVIQGSVTNTDIIAPLELFEVVEWSDGAALPANIYGDNPQVPTPWIVYKFNTTPAPVLQVNDFLAGLGIPASPPCTVRWVGSGAYDKYVIVDNHTYTGYPTLAIPTFGSIVYVTRTATLDVLDISTIADTNIALSPGTNGSVLVDGSIYPQVENTYSLGNPLKRWKDLWVGDSMYMLDQTLNTHWQIHADNGILNLLGGTGVRTGEFLLSENVLSIDDPARDIIIGTTAATGSVVFNRVLKVETVSGIESFVVDRTGVTTINVPVVLDATKSALNIIGSTNGSQQPRNFANTLLQLTAQPGAPARISMDSFGTGAYGLLAARTARGTVVNPAQTKAEDTLLRLTGQGWAITQVVIDNAPTTGYVSKVSAGGTKWNITFNIPAQNTQPQLTSDITGTTYEVDGNSNNLYNVNGLICVASSLTSITLQYPTDPGTYDLVATTIESTGFFVGSISRINLVAKEDFTTTGAGTKVTFQTTPNGTTTISTSATIDDTGLVLTGTTNTSSGVTFRDGTRQTTAATPLPNQANNANKYLKTTGEIAEWAAIPSGITYKGLWNATTNSPTLIDGTGTSGNEYSVIVGGTRDLGHGSITFAQGDFVIYNGDTDQWERIPGAATGITSLTIDGNTYSSSNVTITSTDIVTAIDAGAIANSKLAHDSITINTSTGLSGGGTIALGNLTGLTLTNTGVTSLATAVGSHLSVNRSTDGVTITSDATAASTNDTIALRDSLGGLVATDFTADKDTSTPSNHGAFNTGNLSYSDTGVLASFSSSEIYYNQVIVQNTRSTATASANFIVSNNAGTASANYGEFGMNSTAWTGSGFAAAGAVYLNSISTDLAIGTVGANSLRLITNNTTAVTIASNGVATFAQTIIGSINGNAGTATTADKVAHSLTAGTGITFSTGTTYDGSAAITINATNSGTVTSIGSTTLTIGGTSAIPTVNLPVATASVLGGVKQGTNTTIAVDGTISVATGAGYTLPAATTTTLGGVIIPVVGTSAIINTSGTIGVATASTTQLGAIKIGTGLSIDGNGVVTTSAINAIRNAGIVNAVTIDFSADSIVTCTVSTSLTVSFSNYTIGKVVRVYITQGSAQTITHGLAAANTNLGSTTLSIAAQKNTPNTVFIQYTCIGGSLATTFGQIVF